MALTRQYSANLVEINFFGVDLKPGLAAGTFIQEARNAPNWSARPTGTPGRAIRSEGTDRTGTLTLLVDMESAVHQRLKGLAATDRQFKNVVGPLAVTDRSSGERFVYKDAYIMSVPDESRTSTENTSVSWVFNFADVEKSVSIDNNIVP